MVTCASQPTMPVAVMFADIVVVVIVVVSGRQRVAPKVEFYKCFPMLPRR